MNKYHETDDIAPDLIKEARHPMDHEHFEDAVITSRTWYPSKIDPPKHQSDKRALPLF